jgi:hypothetical protein
MTSKKLEATFICCGFLEIKALSNIRYQHPVQVVHNPTTPACSGRSHTKVDPLVCRFVLSSVAAGCRLTPQALADLCVARQLYSNTLMRIKQQRQLLVLQLAQLVSNTHSRPAAQTYRTDAVFYGLAGEPLRGTLVCGLYACRLGPCMTPHEPRWLLPGVAWTM